MAQPVQSGQDMNRTALVVAPEEEIAALRDLLDRHSILTCAAQSEEAAAWELRAGVDVAVICASTPHFGRLVSALLRGRLPILVLDCTGMHVELGRALSALGAILLKAPFEPDVVIAAVHVLLNRERVHVAEPEDVTARFSRAS